MQVAVIGLGAMGLAMAERLAEQGQAVRGWDRDPARRRAAEAADVTVAEDAATGAEVVILSLPNDAAVRAVAATLPAAGMMADGVVVDTSTVRLVETGLVDEAGADALEHVAQELGRFERVAAAFQLAGAADEGERQMVADFDGRRFHARNANDGSGVHGCPYRVSDT